MQKAVGSSPIIRLYSLQNGIFGCLFRQHMTFCTRRGDELSPFGGHEPSTPLLTMEGPRVPGNRLPVSYSLH
jgi:hypothetical protein